MFVSLGLASIATEVIWDLVILSAVGPDAAKGKSIERVSRCHSHSKFGMQLAYNNPHMAIFWIFEIRFFFNFTTSKKT